MEHDIPQSDLVFHGIRKRSLSFYGDARPNPRIAVGAIASIDMQDEEGTLHHVRFKVTRNKLFELSAERWIYGALLDAQGGYIQLEIRLHEDPRRDTLDLFPSAPPVE